MLQDGWPTATGEQQCQCCVGCQRGTPRGPYSQHDRINQREVRNWPGIANHTLDLENWKLFCISWISCHLLMDTNLQVATTIHDYFNSRVLRGTRTVSCGPSPSWYARRPHRCAIGDGSSCGQCCSCSWLPLEDAHITPTRLLQKFFAIFRRQKCHV